VSGSDSRDEIAAALLPEQETQLAEAVRAAWAPSELDAQRHERILRDVLDDPFAEPSEDERREADALRRALDGDGQHPDAELARHLVAALRLTPVELGASERALEKALPPRAQRSNLILVAFGVAASGLALAAGVALVIASLQRSDAPAARQYTASRSLSPLLHADAAELSPSQRIDRVVSVRARELRANRYAAWGVR
jgi:hypothetical protein